MTALHPLFRFFPRRRERRVLPLSDGVGESLRAAVAAAVRAKATNVETYEARVNAMIEDLLKTYGVPDAGPR